MGRGAGGAGGGAVGPQVDGTRVVQECVSIYIFPLQFVRLIRLETDRVSECFYVLDSIFECFILIYLINYDWVDFFLSIKL